MWEDERTNNTQNDKDDLHVGLLLSFKSMMMVINRIDEEQKEWNDRHPRDNFRRIWGGAMLMLLLFICFSYKVLMLATIPFIAFYFFVLIKLSKVYKRFNYKRTPFWLTTVGGLLVEIGISITIRLILKL